MLQYMKPCCNALKHVAIYQNMLQYIKTCCNATYISVRTSSRKKTSYAIPKTTHNLYMKVLRVDRQIA